ncbi:hypothetical protein PUNSTDRAFT_100866 [Punctularia strigosozonata HHB-11173 SS5]|uniref:uncharacterized protein n=1 Tax=Punctularia strigosozonata (strain HHB-11173) TaxID=741275 RepID=UPI00044172EB|nr:uncharacterized protein PUNSTDRAFT_100866 [Punctularia strigosozonata HHB-11173 SS5]EIN10954.1 hypothetical protein PUNSTDRAFT_100866 [Punctularia strigosozonata HHB-11173 SS5]
MSISHSRTASFGSALLSCAGYAYCAAQSLSAWRTFKWDLESEWEGSEDPWNLTGLKLLSALVVAYFTFAAIACVVGLWGVARNCPAKVRFYRDYSIGDFAVSTIGTGLVIFSLSNTQTRSEICEQLSSRPEVLRDLIESGLSLENCESWLERSVYGTVAIMGILLMLRAHALVALSVYYRRLVRPRTADFSTMFLQTLDSDMHPQRVLLLPGHRSRSGRQLVYAPVSLSEADARQLHATEAWIAPSASSTMPATLSPTNGSRHRYCEPTGRISLPIAPGEGLLPVYKETV